MSLVSSMRAGLGKLVFSTLNNTYNWMLAGDDRDYTAYWSLLIDKAARKTTLSKSLEVLTDVPQVNREINVQVLSATQPDSVSVSGIKPAFAQSAWTPFLWSGKFWSSKQGWQTVANIKGSADDVYIFGENDWAGIKNSRKIFVTNSYANKNLLNYTHEQQKADKISRQLPKIWFYLLFLVAVAFLWAEAKFSAI